MPGLLGLLGGTSAGLAIAPALQALTWPLLALTLLMLGRGWYLQLSHGGGFRSTWATRSRATLIGATSLSVLLWGLRFGGLLGPGPL